MIGKLVTVEGCEGSGKSTQIRLLQSYCEKSGQSILVTREPGGTSVAEKIRDIILFDKSGSMTAQTEVMLYAAARAQHVGEVILPALKQGKIIICDRFIHSTIAYQGYGRGISIDLINRLNDISLCGIKPDLTLFLDISPKAAFIRKGGKDKNDRLEMMEGGFHERVYQGYSSIDEPNYIKIDASGEKQQTHQKIITILREYGILR